MKPLVDHFRYAVRLLRKSPVFAVVAVVTLAIGIGANTAIFSVADALLLCPLPYCRPERLVIRHGLALAAGGVVIGVTVALATVRVLSSLLYHVSATDPMTFVASSLLFTSVGLAASYIPARRAMKVDPIVALK